VTGRGSARNTVFAAQTTCVKRHRRSDLFLIASAFVEFRRIQLHLTWTCQRYQDALPGEGCRIPLGRVRLWLRGFVEEA
jgi:hypothetical protein